MPTLTINGVEVTVPAGTNVLQAAEQAGFEVPYFCYHPGLSAPANCRMCLVEIEGARKLEPSCYTKVRDGMVVKTESDMVVSARRSVLEFILVNHPIDCPICDQAGECWLQDNYLKYDAQPSRVRTEKVSKTKVYPIGPEVVYDGERCILCTRCVRFCEEVAGTAELIIFKQADTTEIRAFPGMKL
ncbi:MAG: (2Fe-2S)-binding protein, partial [Myxococcales bacterium]|nr:(2Fe-2S)-binding protein [Myxococcales bacterium]